MHREYFMKTERAGFSKWSANDRGLAELLWGDPEVTKYISASGRFSEEDIIHRLNQEISNDRIFHVQYWPVFELTATDLIGCCGLRPHNTDEYEIGFHLRPKYWGQGYGTECAGMVIHHAFAGLRAKRVIAGHNPNNIGSQRLLKKLGFRYIGEKYYAPTGLYHPAYELTGNALKEE